MNARTSNVEVIGFTLFHIIFLWFVLLMYARSKQHVQIRREHENKTYSRCEWAIGKNRIFADCIVRGSAMCIEYTTVPSVYAI